MASETEILDVLPYPETQVGGTPDLCGTQNLVEILEFDAVVLLHGFTPEMFR
ncbi:MULTISPECIES: hypothetical protein [unclassified Bradyrhizobium]|uniref:hypothetical protein n=1 Tax=unclassified Bradyrhizobium TaxID=2631580 RepID=UPI00041EAA6E|nr:MULTISPECIES: hypothetical protein [unclassified Bradyrhizobium]QIG92654.1 hypothetical protein G6P99_09155 [Bradyrhizobium sp. 6(2017)]